MDIFEAIDRATGCHFCEGPMDGSVSDLFCCERFQQAWAARNVGADVEPASPFEHLLRQHHQLQARRFFLGGEVPAPPERSDHGLFQLAPPGVVYTVLDETHVWRDEQLAAFMRVHHEAMRARIVRMMAGLAPAFVALGEAWRVASENIQAAHAVLVEAGVVEKPLPADPQARALALRKRRNTGPQQQRRAPRAINPRRAR